MRGHHGALPGAQHSEQIRDRLPNPRPRLAEKRLVQRQGLGQAFGEVDLARTRLVAGEQPGDRAMRGKPGRNRVVAHGHTF